MSEASPNESPTPGLSEDELDLVVDEYVTILNEHGPDSAQERELLARYRDQDEVLRLLRTARAMKALYATFVAPIEPSPAPTRDPH